MDDSIARILLTDKCYRACGYCPNRYKQTEKPTPIDLDEDGFALLAKYDQLCLTGGEPLRFPERTLDLIAQLHENNEHQKRWLYTAQLDPFPRELWMAADGVTITLHYADVKEVAQFHALQKLVAAMTWSTRKDRLVFIGLPRVRVDVDPKAWSHVKVKPPLQDGKCPVPESGHFYSLGW
jgi:organic radical activating enzyme